MDLSTRLELHQVRETPPCSRCGAITEEYFPAYKLCGPCLEKVEGARNDEDHARTSSEEEP